MDLEPGDLRAFLALADWGHYGHAASAASLTKSGLSRAVSRLEHAVGAELVMRDSTGVHGLTPAGRALARHAPAILEQMRSAVVEARRIAATRVVRVTVPGYVDDRPPMPLWPRLLTELDGGDPPVRLRYVPVPFLSMWTCLREERVDLVLNTVDSPDPRTLSTPVAPCPRVLAVGRSHPLADHPYVTQDDLSDLVLLTDERLPRAFMAVALLADVRDVRDTRTEQLDVSDMRGVLQRIYEGDTGVVTQDSYGVVPGPFSILPIAGVPQTWHWVDRRRSDNRPEILRVVAAIGRALRGLHRPQPPTD